MNAKTIEQVEEKKKQSFSLDDISSLKYYGHTFFNGTWISENEFYYHDNRQLVFFDVSSFQRKSTLKIADFVSTFGELKFLILHLVIFFKHD